MEGRKHKEAGFTNYAVEPGGHVGLYPETRWFSGQHPVLPRDRGLGTGPHLADVLTHILDDHLVGRNGLHGKQTPLVDPAAAEPELLLPELEGGRQTLPLSALAAVLRGEEHAFGPSPLHPPPRGQETLWCSPPPSPASSP